MAHEPGLDVHEWESEWASLEDEIADSPEGALPAIHHLITRMLSQRRILDDDLVANEGADPDWIQTWQAGAELVTKLDHPGIDVEQQDVVDQIEEYRGLFEALLEQRPAP